jgi:regulator of sirC expression with transglutaminase-like and TPR domain
VSTHLTESQKKSLFRLLSDDDTSTLTLVKQQLIDQGQSSLPQLESWLKEVKDTPAEQHLLEVLNYLKHGHCHNDFLEFCSRISTEQDFDLEEASFLLAATEYAAVDMTPYRATLDEIAAEVRLQMTREGYSSEIRALSFVLHEKYRFRGNRDRYYEADNTFINRVLERRMGVPITLSLLYILVAKRLEIPIYGVALPGHFIITWKDQFFDPFNHGRLLSEEACKQMVESRGQEFQSEQLRRATSLQVLSRMLMNLARVYEIEENRPHLSRIRKYLQALGAL